MLLQNCCGYWEQEWLPFQFAVLIAENRSSPVVASYTPSSRTGYSLSAIPKKNPLQGAAAHGSCNISGVLCDGPVQVCSSIERLPGITSATHSLTVPAGGGASERLVCGFQVRQLASAACRPIPLPEESLAMLTPGRLNWCSWCHFSCEMDRNVLLPRISSCAQCEATVVDLQHTHYCEKRARTQGSDFVIASMTAGREVWRTGCGGLHRPAALHLGSAGAFTFAHLQGGFLHVHRCGARPGSFPWSCA